MKILVVDDNPDICALLKNILQAEGYDVESCCEPRKMSDAIRENRPHLLITDMLMSGVDGRTLAENLRKDPATKGIKIMMMSGHPDALNATDNPAIDEVLPKPFEIQELLDKVEKLLAKAQREPA